MRKFIIAALLLALATPALATVSLLDSGTFKSANDMYTSRLEYYVLLVEGVRVLILRDSEGIHTQKLNETTTNRQPSAQSHCAICHSK